MPAVDVVDRGGGRWDARRLHDLLGEDLGALEARPPRAGPNARAALGAVDEPRDERRLGPDDDEVDRLAARERDEPGESSTRRRQRAAARDARVTGRTQDTGSAGERASARTRACSRPPDPTTRTFTAQRAMKSSTGIARQVSYLRGAARAQLERHAGHRLSSGASTTLTKSNRPSVDHWALTLAPNCSSSLLTSRMRCGLFLIVRDAFGRQFC